MLKYICGAAMILSLLGAFVCAMLGMSYHYVGNGLHPALAGMLIVVLLVLGYLAARLLEKAE